MLAPPEATKTAIAMKGKAKLQEKEKERVKSKEEVSKKSKGKEKVSEKSKGKAKATRGRGRKKSIGIEIREPAGDNSSSSDSPVQSYRDDPSIDSKRWRMYSSKLCIGERNVAIDTLFKQIPSLRDLVWNGDVFAVCGFPEQTGYCLELIREFYMRAGFLEDTEGGTYSFKTSVRGVEMTITPDAIAQVLERVAETNGVDYLNSGFDAVGDWKKILNGLCVPDTFSNGILIMSKDLKIEYRFLNFIVCYNLMPLANTKIVRWERMLYMYLLGHPELAKSKNVNLNIPFLIWKRMAKEIKTASQQDRLPFPLIIMRMLRQNVVDVRCSSYEHSLGIIGGTSLAKSSSQLQSELRRSPSKPAAPSSSKRSAKPQQEVTLDSIHQEQRRLSIELSHLSTEQARLTVEVTDLRRMIKAIFDKLGCGTSELPPPDAASD